MEDEEIKETLEVDLNELLFAYRDDSPDNAYYLDTDSGAIKLVNRSLLDLRDLTDEIERARYRFKYVPKPDRKLLLNDLRSFWNTVADAKLKSILDIAFESPHVLHSFKKILEGSPEQTKRLEEFLTQTDKQRLEEWMQANFIEFVWKGASINSPIY